MTKRKYAGAHGGDREAVEDEGGGVICQSLAFEHDQDPLGELHSARDRERRDGVGRRDYGAQYEAHRPSETQQPVTCRCDCNRRERDATHGQQPDRAEIESELAPAHRHRGRVDDGRQYQKQHQLRGEFHGR
ncbi:MAG: hypothetical protein WB683_17390 [Candidatus Sulfotelmatobacter sp.]